jgi:hypothetical protein
MGYARGRMEPSWAGRWVRAGVIGWVVARCCTRRELWFPTALSHCQLFSPGSKTRSKTFSTLSLSITLSIGERNPVDLFKTKWVSHLIKSFKCTHMFSLDDLVFEALQVCASDASKDPQRNQGKSKGGKMQRHVKHCGASRTDLERCRASTLVPLVSLFTGNHTSSEQHKEWHARFQNAYVKIVANAVGLRSVPFSGDSQNPPGGELDDKIQ